MPATNAWDETKPAGTDLASTIDNQMRAMKLDIRERLALEHYWNATLATDGKHKEITISPASVNVPLIFGTMQQVTGVDSTEAMILQTTWNTTGAPTGIGLYVTDTASDPASLFINFKLNGASRFKVSKAGVVIGTSFIGDGSTLTGIAETAIVNGAILARVADAEVITGKWTIAASTGVVIASGVPAVTTNTLYSSGGALFFNGASLATGSSVSGTTGHLGLFTGTTAIGNSSAVESGGIVTFANWIILERGGSPFLMFSESGTGKGRVGVTGTSMNFALGDGTTIAAMTLATNDPTISLLRFSVAEAKWELFGGNTFFDFTGSLNIRKYVGSSAVVAFTDVGTQTLTSVRSSGVNVDALVLADTVTGGQAVGFGNRITWRSNGGGSIASIGFEVGGTGTNNETQLSFFTQPSSGNLTRRWGVAASGGFTGPNGNVFINGGGVSCASGDCAGGVFGTPSAFRISAQGTLSGAVINFSVAFTSTPICVCGSHNGMAVWSPGPFSNQVTISWTSAVAATIWCHCFGQM